VQAAAADAAWELPRTLAVLVVAGARRGSAAMHLPPESIAETVGELSVVVLPDPEAPGRLGELEHAVAEQSLTAALGPSVDWPDAPISFARGRAALELAGSEPELVVARDRIGELMLRTDARLAGELAATRLAPLDELSPGSRGRLRETLSAWLAEQGRIAPTAARLGVHPQTARYRISRLRELFGASLDDPDERFWLDFALRVPR
jgi:sugar diacid utilization regulator